MVFIVRQNGKQPHEADVKKVSLQELCGSNTGLLFGFDQLKNKTAILKIWLQLLMLWCNLSKYESQVELTPITEWKTYWGVFLYCENEPERCGWKWVYKLYPLSTERNKKKNTQIKLQISCNIIMKDRKYWISSRKFSSQKSKNNKKNCCSLNFSYSAIIRSFFFKHFDILPNTCKTIMTFPSALTAFCVNCYLSNIITC